MFERKFDTGYAARELNGVGLDPEEVMDAWAASAVTNQATLEANLQTLRTLELTEKGAPKILNKEFGIKNFGRYPVEVLLKQLDQRHNTEDESVLWIAAEFDPYAEFYKFSSRVALLDKSLESGANLRIVECETAEKTIERLAQMKERYSPISRSVWVAHGYPDGMVIGSGSEINKSTLAGELGQSLVAIYAPESSSVLVSCKTGAEGGFGQDFSARLRGKIQAPLFRTSLDAIRAQASSTNPRDLSVAFLTDQSMRHREYALFGDKAIYEKGRLAA